MTPTPTTLARLRWQELIGTDHHGEWFSVAADRAEAFEYASYLEASDGDDPYPDGLLEGFHLLALLDRFGSAAIAMDTPGHVGWNYGLERVRFVSPVKIGDRLRIRASVTDVRAKGDDAFLIEISYVAELENSDRPAFTAHMLVYQRSAEE
jgi:acyl-coenzyme A thioesterase PaaI-like protein